ARRSATRRARRHLHAGGERARAPTDGLPRAPLRRRRQPQPAEGAHPGHARADGHRRRRPHPTDVRRVLRSRHMDDPAFSLDNKTALVVGAANGIGRATALTFAAAGAAVACGDVEDAKPTAAEIGDRALAVHLDVTDSASCRAAVVATVERFGGLDVLLYGAADSDQAATVLELDEAAWERVIRIN